MASAVVPSRSSATVTQIVASLAPRRAQPPSVANTALQELVATLIGTGPIGWVVETASAATELLARRNPERVLELSVIQAINEDVAFAMLLALVGKSVPLSMWAAAHERAIRAAVVDRVPLDRAIANVRAIQQFWIHAIRDHAVEMQAPPDVHQKIVIAVTRLMDRLLDTQIKIYLTERGDLLDSTSAHRHRLVEDLVRGNIVGNLPRDTLGLELNDKHVAVVLTAVVDSSSGANELHLVAVHLKMQMPSRSFLVHEAEQQTLWIWASGSSSGPDVAATLLEVIGNTPIRAGVGSAHSGTAGFRRSHLEAVRAERMVRTAAVGTVVRYSDVALASLMHGDAEWTNWFAEDHLGALADPGPVNRELRKTLQLFCRCQMRLVPTARELGIHRNTLITRLRRIEGLLGHPLAEKLPEIMCAILIMDIADPAVGVEVRANTRQSTN